MWCNAGHCVKNTKKPVKQKIAILANANTTSLLQVGNSQKPGQWTEWKKGACKSGKVVGGWGKLTGVLLFIDQGCTENSKGYQEMTRECQQPNLVHTVQGCRGPATTMNFCDDTNICAARKDTSRWE